MKKFISMVMAAAMVTSLVPATAFAAEITTKVVDAAEWTEVQADAAKSAKQDLEVKGAQLQLKVKDLDTKINSVDDYEVKLMFDNAEFIADGTEADGAFTVKVYDKDTNKTYDATKVAYEYEAEDDDVTIEFSEDAAYDIDEDDIVYITFNEGLKLTSYKVGTEATVAVSGDLGSADARVFAAVVDKGLDVDVDDTVDVAEEEIEVLEDITIEASAGDVIGDAVAVGDDITLKLNKGFEFTGVGNLVYGDSNKALADRGSVEIEDDEITITLTEAMADSAELVIKGLEIEATTAKAGDVAVITVKGDDCDAVKVEVATVVAEGLKVSVDEDEDVPEMWSGVDKDNTGLTSDDSHESLEITLEETVKGAYSNKDEIEFVLPEGVYVVGVVGDLSDELAAAYEEGEYESLIIEKRVIDETRDKAKGFEYEFALELIAEAWFTGDVVMEVLVDGESIGEVTIATFKAPFAVEAQSNDLIIDYRNTEIPTDVVIKEAEDGLWAKGLTFFLSMEDEYIDFEKDPEVTTNVDDSDMEVDVDVTDATIEVTIDEESDDEVGVITISEMSLYMSRNLAAGAYDLELSADASNNFYLSQLWTKEATGLDRTKEYDGFNGKDVSVPEFYTVADAKGYVDKKDLLDVPNMVVKEGFVNIITAGRDKDDASFTTKVVVPVGESYMIAGEQTVALDVPAYVSASGYTMLPVRAVAVALGILNNNVLWDQATKTVTILYGQRIITMTVGAKVINVNGSAIPASSSPEVVDGRTFLPMRDLATALGVTDITWDAATKTATLNGNK